MHPRMTGMHINEMGPYQECKFRKQIASAYVYILKLWNAQYISFSNVFELQSNTKHFIWVAENNQWWCYFCLQVAKVIVDYFKNTNIAVLSVNLPTEVQNHEQKHKFNYKCNKKKKKSNRWITVSG